MHFQGRQIPSSSNTIRSRVRMIFLQDLDYLLDKSAGWRKTMIVDISHRHFGGTLVLSTLWQSPIVGQVQKHIV